MCNDILIGSQGKRQLYNKVFLFHFEKRFYIFRVVTKYARNCVIYAVHIMRRVKAFIVFYMLLELLAIE